MKIRFLEKTRTVIRIAWYGSMLVVLYAGLELWKAAVR